MQKTKFSILFALAAVTMAALYSGCSSSDESTDQGTSSTPSQEYPLGQGQSAQKEDTVSVAVQNTPRPTYETKTPPPPATPTGQFSVQIGAYRERDNADQIAALARERFRLNVYTVNDKATALFKVMIGDFSTKDDARAFRDRMTQQYPGEYNDAWVSERPEK